MTDSQLLTAVGGALTAVGVAFALVGTTSLRRRFRRFYQLLAPPKPRPPKLEREPYLSGVQQKPLRGERIHWQAGLDDVYRVLEGELEAVRRRLVDHRHDDLARKLNQLTNDGRKARRDFAAWVGENVHDAQTAEKWNRMGLLYAVVGAAMQVAAVFF